MNCLTVSIATVSLVFNRKPGVGKETRERVLKVARELNYRRTVPHGDDIPKGRTVRFLKISRRLILNGIVWTAQLEVPATGVRTELPDLAVFEPASVDQLPRSVKAKARP